MGCLIMEVIVIGIPLMMICAGYIILYYWKKHEEKQLDKELKKFDPQIKKLMDETNHTPQSKYPDGMLKHESGRFTGKIDPMHLGIIFAGLAMFVIGRKKKKDGKS